MTRLPGEPVRSSAHVELLALHPRLYQPLHEALMHPAVLEAWRPRGRYVPVNEWERFLTGGLHHGMAVRTSGSEELVGFVELRDYEPTDRHGYLSAATSPAFIGSGLMVEACGLFLDEIFSRFPIRKVYALLTDQSSQVIGDACATFLTREGTLTAHVFINGTHRDVTVASVSRTTFVEMLERRRAASRLPIGDWRLLDADGPHRADTAESPVRDLLAVYGLASGVTVGPTTSLRDLFVDSLGLFELLVAFEEEVDRPVPEELFSSIETVGELSGWLQERG